MPSFFSVIRFVPSAISDESINVGVLLVDDKRIEVRALDHWQRVKSFSPNWKEVRRIVEDMANDPGSFLGIQSAQNADQLRSTLQQWTRSVQFSEVRASLASLSELQDTLPQMLLDTTSVELPASGRRAEVLKAVYQAAVTAYTLRFERHPKGIIQKQLTVPGRRTQHKVDVGIANGNFYAGAFALSFATGQTEKQWRDTDAVAYAIEDMTVSRDAMAVVLDAPSASQSQPYSRAVSLFRDLKVTSIGVDGISAWANRAVTSVPEHAAH